MIAEIEKKIREKLKTSGFNFRDTELRENQRTVNYPAAFVFVQTGGFKKMSMATTRCDLSISLVIAFKDTRSETVRRDGITPILEGVISLLFMETLGLSIAPIKPKQFRNITDRDMIDSHVIAYQIELSTAYDFKPRPEEADELLRVGLSYLKPDSEESLAESIVELREGANE